MITGRDLKAERARAGLLQREVAERLGVSRTRVAQAERFGRVPPGLASRYLAALDGTDPVSERVAAAVAELAEAVGALDR